jgi:hypothetical protein
MIFSKKFPCYDACSRFFKYYSILALMALMGSACERPAPRIHYYNVTVDAKMLNTRLEYVLNDRKFSMPVVGRQRFFIDSAAEYDTFFLQSRTSRFPALRSLTLLSDDSIVYAVNYDQNPERWDDWVNDGNNVRTWNLLLEYRQVPVWFIIENRDTTRSYQLRYSTPQFRDSIVTIPRGFSARVIYVERLQDFQPNLRYTEALFQRIMNAEMTSQTRRIPLPFAVWSFGIAVSGEWFVRYRIMP